MTTIPLAPRLLAGSSDLPGGFGRAVLNRHPIWSCSVRGFACHPCCHERGALLPHLFTLTPRLGACAPRSGRYVFCATVRQVTLPGRYPAHCPSEFGLSSRLRRWLRPTGCEACPPSPARRPAVVWLTATLQLSRTVHASRFSLLSSCSSSTRVLNLEPAEHRT